MKFRDLNKNFCSSTWAKRLFELGVRQDTYFHWIYDEINQIWKVSSYDFIKDNDKHYAAFTAQDFVDLFPRLFKFARDSGSWKFYCEYADMTLHENEENMSNVFARILVSIAKNKVDNFKKLGIS